MGFIIMDTLIWLILAKSRRSIIIINIRLAILNELVVFNFNFNFAYQAWLLDYSDYSNL